MIYNSCVRQGEEIFGKAENIGKTDFFRQKDTFQAKKRPAGQFFRECAEGFQATGLPQSAQA